MAPRFIEHVIEVHGGGGRSVPTLLADDDVPDTGSGGGLVLGDGTTLPEKRATTGEDGVVEFSFDVVAEADRLQARHGEKPNFH
ncbi:hypothetical protein PU560_08050, partial [Georgenia sp. 10Sc9-8]|nr:hypothetical protein [Georgenia halotolerans]